MEARCKLFGGDASNARSVTTLNAIFVVPIVAIVTVEYSVELLRLLAFGTFVIVVLIGLLYFADALHVFTDEEASVGEEEVDAEHSDTAYFQFDIADNLTDVIGTYGETPIHRCAEIGGVSYEFVHVYCHACKMVVQADARCLAPGLVYLPAHSAVAPSE